MLGEEKFILWEVLSFNGKDKFYFAEQGVASNFIALLNRSAGRVTDEEASDPVLTRRAWTLEECSAADVDILEYCEHMDECYEVEVQEEG